jgi:transposase-like protein
VPLRLLGLKSISFETAIIERYRQRESSMEGALIEMYNETCNSHTFITHLNRYFSLEPKRDKINKIVQDKEEVC